jgi:hypothetical protein
MASRAVRDGLKAAADRFAAAMKTVAAVRTRRTAEAVNTVWDGDTIVIRAGRPEGVYGWEPVQAKMFDNNLRHPLFGDKKHWYHQGRYPITKYTEKAALNDAVERFADVAVPRLLKEHGFPDR